MKLDVIAGHLACQSWPPAPFLNRVTTTLLLPLSAAATYDPGAHHHCEDDCGCSPAPQVLSMDL
jgi:hypothetical protein